MATKKRRKKQAPNDKSALKLLRDLGIIKKADLRKKPNKRQTLLITELYRALSREKTNTAKRKTKAKGTILSRAADRIKSRYSITGKAAKRATSVRSAKKRARPPVHKTPGASIKQREISDKKIAGLKEPKNALTTYALPFMRKGRDEPEWRRFTYKQLRQFMNIYKPDDPDEAAEWMSYAVVETWTFKKPSEKRAMRSDVQHYSWGQSIDKPRGKIKKPIRNKKKRL